MKEANEQGNKEQRGTSGMTGQGQQPRGEGTQASGKPGSSTEQSQSRSLQGMRSGEEKMQSESKRGDGSRQGESATSSEAGTNGETYRQKQGHTLQRMTPRGWFEGPSWMENPFRMMQRFSEEMDRLFEEFRGGRGMGHSQHGGREALMRWSPQIEMYEKNNQLIVCTDLPGIKQEDIKIDVTDEMLTIHGERRNEFEDTQEGYYRTERSYGNFSRTIPIPEGVEVEQAKASFEHGVLKIMFPLTKQQRTRRIEVGTGTTQQTPGSEQKELSRSSSNL